MADAGWKWLVAAPGPLGAAVYDFNFRPGTYVDPSWIADTVEPAVWTRLAGCARAEPKLSRYILERFELADRFWSDFSAPALRLALLEPGVLRRVALFTGLALSGASLRRIVLGAEVRRLKQEIGEDGYSFAVKRAPFLVGDIAGRVPAGAGGSRSDFEGLGAGCLAAALAGHGPAVTLRLLLKLPKHLVRPAKEPAPPLPGDRLAALLQKIALEVAPACSPLFA